MKSCFIFQILCWEQWGRGGIPYYYTTFKIPRPLLAKRGSTSPLYFLPSGKEKNKKLQKPTTFCLFWYQVTTLMSFFILSHHMNYLAFVHLGRKNTIYYNKVFLNMVDIF